LGKSFSLSQYNGLCLNYFRARLVGVLNIFKFAKYSIVKHGIMPEKGIILKFNVPFQQLVNI